MLKILHVAKTDRFFLLTFDNELIAECKSYEEARARLHALMGLPLQWHRFQSNIDDQKKAA